MISLFVFVNCGGGEPVEQQEPKQKNDVGFIPEPNIDAPNLTTDGKNILIIAGQGGSSGPMFQKAAATYKKKHGGEIYVVYSGDEFVAAVRDFLKKKGKIDHLEYFGHGNQVGLYVNQESGTNGGVYANDPDLDKDYSAASIYELPVNIFAANGSIKFNGCNVAKGYPQVNSLAQGFANYFDVEVVAPLGPTDFSNENDDVYMFATYSNKDFVNLKPQKSIGEFVDVREGQDYTVAVKELMKRGLNLNFKDKKFLPYKNITNAEAEEFCMVVFSGKKCHAPGEKSDRIRNLRALQLLVDAAGVDLKNTNPWYKSYIDWANDAGVLTRDFTDKRWYTRGEMAQLAWGLAKKS
ncbi:hypothetical protein HZA40_04565 [Candidatus Peregrinibacteria bacterium]|nr:hypothetical protein [Candidatus Peregrinibacteria bacterium]